MQQDQPATPEAGPKKLYMVDAISIFRMRYVVEDHCAEWAQDTVCMGDLHEFSQLHLDEIQTSVREITEAEYLEMFDQDNAYLKDWDTEAKMRLINRRPDAAA